MKANLKILRWVTFLNIAMSALMIRNGSVIEANMDCVSVTPRRHRDELFKYVNRPFCLLLKYRPCTSDDVHSAGTALHALIRAGRESNPTAMLGNASHLHDIVPSPSALDGYLQQFWQKTE